MELFRTNKKTIQKGPQKRLASKSHTCPWQNIYWWVFYRVQCQDHYYYRFI